MTINAATAAYIRQHADADVRQLALQGVNSSDVDLAFALDQIAGRQTAHRKLPSWAAIDGIVYPPHLSMEQCSSELAARYKGGVIGKACLATDGSTPREFRFVDLTGGFGVDFVGIAQRFISHSSPDAACLTSSFVLTYVERQEHLCDIARTNFQLLGLGQAEVVCADAEEYLRLMSPVDLIYIDPARRDSHGSRTYGISDCTPDVIALLSLLQTKARRLLLKLSPMLDWRKAVSDLGEENVIEVHIVSVQNECKELLVLMEPTPSSSRREGRLICSNIVNADELQRFEYHYPLSNTSGNNSPSMALGHQYPLLSGGETDDGSLACYLYEPNASIMKAGCFNELSARFGVTPLAQNSHLFVSATLIPDFPGRCFAVTAVTSLNKRELKVALSGLTRVNITVRNFPLTVAELRRRLKLSEGGSTYIFATTLANGDKILLLCRKP